MNQIKKRPLGNTGLALTELGLGGVYLSPKKGADPVALIRRAKTLGINFFDTAPIYAGGDSQQAIGEALSDESDACVLATKCGRWGWENGPYRDLDAYKAQLESSLNILNRDCIDVFFIHEADWAVYWEDMPLPRLRCELELTDTFDYESAPVTQFLVWAQEQKMIKHLGLSGNNSHLLTKVLHEFPLRIEAVLVAFQYSLIWRNIKPELLPAAKEKNVGVILGSPLQQGKLAVPHPEWVQNPPEWMDEDTRQRFANLYALQQDTGLSLAELSVRYLLADPNFTSMVIGSSNMQHLEDNVAYAQAGPLPPDIHNQVESLGKVFPGLWGKDF